MDAFIRPRAYALLPTRTNCVSSTSVLWTAWTIEEYRRRETATLLCLAPLAAASAHSLWTSSGSSGKLNFTNTDFAWQGGMSQPLDDDRTVAAEAGHRGGGAALGAHVLPIGTRLHEFEIIDLIGEGGFGIVYLARDCVLERKVALKEYLPSALASRGPGMTVAPTSSRSSETFEIGLKSFMNEARMLAQFDHPALVKVYRFWEANGTAYMVMPYYEGITLKEELRSADSPPDEIRLKQLLAQLLDALEILHRAQALHRDIAPDNILILPDGNPVLLDFGAARRVITDRTQNLTAILKPGYAPLEQYAESPSIKQGPWTDLYALAAVVHFAITGEKPAPSVARTIADPVVPLNQAASGRYSPQFLRALDQALAVKPDDRPQNVEEFRSLLELDRVQGTVTRKTQQLQERSAAGRNRRRLGLLVGVAVVLVGAISAGAVLLWDRPAPSAPIATATPAPGPQSKPPPEVIDTPSAAVPIPAVPTAAAATPAVPPPAVSSVVPRPPKQPSKADARPEDKLALLAAAFLQDGEKCFRAKQYDCAIAKADAALQVDPGSAPARQLKTAAAEEQQRALKQIKID
jgi:serine/threonine protein kinase